MELKHPMQEWLERSAPRYAGDFHDWLRGFTIAVASLEPDPEKAAEWASRCAEAFRRRDPAPREVPDLIDGAYPIIAGTRTPAPRPGRNAVPRPALQAEFAGKPGDHEKLRLSSDQRHFTAGRVLLELFHPDDRLCICRTEDGGADFASAGEWASRPDLHTFQFILPSPVRPDSVARSATDVPVRKYYVHETDQDFDFDQQTGLILALGNVLPLRMVVRSAGKSLHAWYDADPVHEEEFFATSISLGGDAHMALRSQICRLPLGHRPPTKKGGGLQNLDYLRPQA